MSRFVFFISLLLTLTAVAPLAVQAQNLTMITVYVQNPTSGPISYTYKRGGDDWQKGSLGSGQTVTLKGIAPHTIRYHNGQKVMQYNVPSGATYYFEWRNKVLGLYSRPKR